MKRLLLNVAFVALATIFFGTAAHAGGPYVNTEGVGGVAYNPLAYPAATPGQQGFKIGAIEIAKPRLGAFYINLNDTGVDWSTMGIATSFNKRVETSFGYELVAIGAMPVNSHKYNFGAKVALLDENAFGTNFVPAVSVGGVWKKTTFSTQLDQNALDLYLVATKLITQLPKPVLLSGGVLSTRGQVNGIIGFNEDREEVFFGNIDVFPLSWLAVGFEYKQGPSYDTYKDADYYNVHAAWFVDDKLSLVAAYANAGKRNVARYNGLGGGPVISAQYSF